MGCVSTLENMKGLFWVHRSLWTVAILMVLLNLIMCEHGMSVCSEFCGIAGVCFVYENFISKAVAVLFCAMEAVLFRPCSLKPASTTEGEGGRGCLIVPGCWGSWKLGPAALQKNSWVSFSSVTEQLLLWHVGFGVDSCHHLIGMWLFQRKVGLCQHRKTKLPESTCPREGDEAELSPT